MFKTHRQTGALLIEALIAATILAVGIVTSLKVFSGALFVSDRSMKMSQAYQLLDDQFFGWFLDPSSFDPNSTKGSLADSNQKIRLDAQVSLQKLQPPVPDEKKQSESKDQNFQPPMQIANEIEFYEASYRITGAKQRSVFQNLFYLVQYGKPKNS